jgi:large subunit ribosomal protein L18
MAIDQTAVKNRRRARRTLAVRAKLARTSSRARLCVKHISAQVVERGTGRTLASVSTTSKAFIEEFRGKTKSQRAAEIGKRIAQAALAAGIDTVVLDRGSSRFHGRVKALADAAREAGLKF